MTILKLLKKHSNIVFLVLIVFFAIFLRFYKLEQFATFLADQGRDAIIVKRIATFEHFTAIGPPTSVGHVFSGPFYYYFIAPWFWLFNFQPVALAFGIAFFSIVFLVTNYFVMRNLSNSKVAFISTFFLAFSSTMIEFSRFSWNPNPLPFFALLSYVVLIKSFEKKNYFLFVLFGALIAFSIQLHYLALFLILPSIVLFLVKMFEREKSRKNIFLGGIVSVISFIVCSSPLIIFDLKHNFLNAKSFIALIQSPSQIASNKIDNFFLSFNYLNQYSFHINFPIVLASLFAVILICYFVYTIRSVKSIITPFNTLFLFLMLTFVGVSLYPGPKHAHYFGIIYPFYYVVIAYLLSRLLINKGGIILVSGLLIAYILFNAQGYSFFYRDQQNQIQHAKKVSAFLNTAIGNKPFNFAVQPDSWQEDSYLYFLELGGKRPANREKQEVTDQMFVVCGDPCNLYITRSWNVTMFGKFKIQDQWSIEGVKIYKLIH